MHLIKTTFSHALRRIMVIRVMVIRKIVILNIQLAKDNFATPKPYHLKLSTCKFIKKSNSKLVILFQTRKINFQVVKRN